MTSLTLLQTVLATAIGVASAMLIVVGLAVSAWFRRPGTRVTAAQLEGLDFLFDGEDLVEASDDGRAILGRGPAEGSDLARLTGILRTRFADLGRDPPAEGTQQKRRLLAQDDSDSWLEVEQWGSHTRLRLGGSGAASVDAQSRLVIDALEAELATLRAIGEDSPQLIWRTDPGGQIAWANRAYLDLADQIGEAGTPSWPPATLFGAAAGVDHDALPSLRRFSVTPADKSLRWFDVTTVARGGGLVHFATAADAVVRAEQARRDFVQTLSKTFADLAIGLAIFDRQRRLALFNPALHDLTALPPDFLSARPLLHSFLDRMREARMLPEPKNYRDWRSEIAALEQAATDGTYCQNWDLPNGLTYRVTGRPHPDGAIAFLIEDISAEIALARTFRAELETSQAVLDSLDDAVAVFSGSGTLILSNRAYEQLWGADDDAALADKTVRDQARIWRARCAPTPFWTEAQAMIGNSADRGRREGRAQLLDGRSVQCRVSPLAGAAIMIGFRILSGQAAGNAHGEAAPPLAASA